MSIKRAAGIVKMRAAVAKGQSRASFLRELRLAGETYRKTTMLADWRNVANLKAKKGLVRFVRKDYRPARTAMAEVDWDLSKPYMYKVKLQSRDPTRDPPEGRFINVMHDIPLTPAEVEAAAWRMLEEIYKPEVEEYEKVTVWTAIHKIM